MQRIKRCMKREVKKIQLVSITSVSPHAEAEATDRRGVVNANSKKRLGM